MKKLLFMALLFLVFVVNADERFETHTGLCHFAYDLDDADNEVYFANCENTIDTHDAGDGTGRMAYGSSIIEKEYDVADWALKHGGSPIYLKGGDASSLKYRNYASATKIPCVMVTSNYDAAADDDNQTVYVSNDWNLEIGIVNVGKTAEAIVNVRYQLSCRNGIKQ